MLGETAQQLLWEGRASARPVTQTRDPPLQKKCNSHETTRITVKTLNCALFSSDIRPLISDFCLHPSSWHGPCIYVWYFNCFLELKYHRQCKKMSFCLISRQELDIAVDTAVRGNCVKLHSMVSTQATSGDVACCFSRKKHKKGAFWDLSIVCQRGTLFQRVFCVIN
jgi:hypothetical protein